MYNFDGKYSIADAPAHLVDLAIRNSSGDIVSSLNVQNGPYLKFTVSASIYIPRDNRIDGFIYLNMYPVGNDQQVYLAQQQVGINHDDQIVQTEFDLSIPTALLVEATGINFQLSLSPKYDGEMGIDESLRIGRFVNTVIPLEEH